MNGNIHIERTLVILKPDTVQRSLIGEIISRFERIGLKFIGIKMLHATQEQVEKHYLIDPEWKGNVGAKAKQAKASKGIETKESDEEVGANVLKQLKQFMSAGPVVVLAIEGAHAIPLIRKLVGGTEPLSSDVGTIRGDYIFDSYIMADQEDRAIRNLIHASSSKSDAEKELQVWFNSGELLDYTTAQERFIYDVNLKNLCN